MVAAIIDHHLAAGHREWGFRGDLARGGHHRVYRRGALIRVVLQETIMINNAVIVDALRTPMGRGKASGRLAQTHPVELLAAALDTLTRRNNLDPALIDDILIGCVGQVGEQSATPGRMAALAAGFPEHVPSTTIDRKCGSSQQAVHFAQTNIVDLISRQISGRTHKQHGIVIGVTIWQR